MIPVEAAHLIVSAITHPGMKGKNNEDRCLVAAFQVSESNPTPALLALIADGVGGHRAGEVAAEMAIEIIGRAVAASDASQPLFTLRAAFEQANRAIYFHSLANPDRAGMGTTCACTWVIGNRLYTASVGDSRIYLIRAGRALQLTVDHTWVQEALESGTLTPEEARSHPNAHVIRRHLGSQQPVETDFRLKLRPEESGERALANQGMLLKPDDRLIICSDGLTDLVTAAEIEGTLAAANLRAALQRLVDLANQRGGHDNISIIGMMVPDKEAPVLAARPRERAWGRVAAAVLLLALLAVAFYGLGRWWPVGPPAATETARPTEAPLALPSLIPTGTPFQPSPTIPSIGPIEVGPATQVGPAATESPATEPQQKTPPGPQATYTPWPTSTGSSP